MGEPADIEIRRLMAAVFQTRRERVLGFLVIWCYRIAERGPIGKLGDWLNDRQVRSWHRRADKGTHLHGKGPKIARAQGRR